MITQLYEIQSPGEAETLCALGVDHIGSVILSIDDWRQPVIRETVRAVHHGGQKSVLIPLFSDPESIYRVLDYYAPDLVHFCEMVSLDPAGRERCCQLIALQREIRRRYPGIAIMRSIPIGRAREQQAVPTLALAELFQPFSDYFLTDTQLSPETASCAQPVEGFVGITGQTCHWETAGDLVAATAIPVILAGGLAPENVADGIHRVRPAGVDSCTRTNRLDARGRPIRFQKDMARVRFFLAEARRAAAELAAAAYTTPVTPA